jgi:hypothetical protein
MIYTKIIICVLVLVAMIIYVYYLNIENFQGEKRDVDTETNFIENFQGEKSDVDTETNFIENFQVNVLEEKLVDTGTTFIEDKFKNVSSNIITIQYNNLYALNSYTFNGLERLEKVYVVGNTPLNILGSNLFYNNLGNFGSKFVITQPPPTEKILIVIYPETIIRLALTNYKTELDGLCYENINTPEYEEKIYKFIQEYATDLSDTLFRELALQVLGVKDTIIDSFNISSYPSNHLSTITPIIRLPSGNYIITRNQEYESTADPVLTPIFLNVEHLTNNTVIILEADDITITCDQEGDIGITPENPIIVPDGWMGLFENGTFDADPVSVNGLCNNYQISNIHIKCMKSDGSIGTLGNSGGGICREYFGNGMTPDDITKNKIENCSFQGTIGLQAGGICGAGCGYNQGTVTINNCYSIGKIGDNGGGICGAGCGYSGGTVTINNCYSIGTIEGPEAGGICGLWCGYSGGSVTIKNCYSTGKIEGLNAGGICGAECGVDKGTVQINNCLYNSDGCENNSITSMASITTPTFVTDNQDKFKKVIGSLASNFKSIDIDNTHYFADMDDFNKSALLSINVSVTSVWAPCDAGGPWLLQWQDDMGIPCGTLPAGGDMECTITLDTGQIRLTSGNYIITRTKPYTTVNDPVLTPIFLNKDVTRVLTTDAVIILEADDITITCDPETINETNPIIVPNGWMGLFQNGTLDADGSAVNGLCNNYKISNIHIKCSGTLGYFGGGICREFFGNGMISDDNLIENCSFQGTIGATFSGGICGAVCGYSGKVQIKNCYSIGTIEGLNAGGICGYGCGQSGTVTINNCYSDGGINGNAAGGICGYGCGYSGTVTINNCYSDGGINGNGAGGICGAGCGYNTGTVLINNCYSIGTIEEMAGGICGSWCGYSGGTVTIKNCLYNSEGCENNSITSMASIPESTLSAQAFVTDNQDKFKKVIGSLAPNFTSIDIDNTHYFADMDDFHTRALLSIAIGVGPDVWHPCTNGGPWLLQWQDDMDIPCGTLQAGGDPTCTAPPPLPLDTDPIPLPSGNYIITRNQEYESTVFTPIFLNEAVAHVLTKEAVIILGEGKITITSDPLTINETKPIIVPELWKGLFQNGTLGADYAPVNGLCNNFEISNIHIKCEGTLGGAGGGICREFFGNGMKSDDDDTNKIENCSFHGNIGEFAGGICGYFCGNSGKVTITNCYSIGKIEGYYAGGICGGYCGYNQGTVTINNCYSIGDIGNYAGGICGGVCGGGEGTVTIKNCYSTGKIEGLNAGGICGKDCGLEEGTVIIKNCLYNSDGCENNSITRMASITTPTFANNQEQFKKVIGSLAPNFKSIDIDNTHYFADMDDFHTRAEKSIAIGVGPDAWTQCTTGGPWLLKWQDNIGVPCGTLPAEGDTTCEDFFGGDSADINYKDTFRLVYYKDMFYETDIAYWRCKYYKKPIQTTSVSGSDDADDELISKYCSYSQRDERYMSCIEALQKKVEEEGLKREAESMQNILSNQPTFNYYENLLTTFSFSTQPAILQEIKDILTTINNLESNSDGCPTVSACSDAQQTWLGNTGYMTDISDKIPTIQSASDFDAEYDLNKTNMVLSDSNKVNLTRSALSTCQVEMLGLESFYGGECKPYIIESDTKRKVLCSSFNMSIDSIPALLRQTNDERFIGLIQKIINAGKYQTSNFIRNEIALANLLFNLQTQV